RTARQVQSSSEGSDRTTGEGHDEWSVRCQSARQPRDQVIFEATHRGRGDGNNPVSCAAWHWMRPLCRVLLPLAPSVVAVLLAKVRLNLVGTSKLAFCASK